MRRALFILVGIIALAAAGYSGWWQYVAWQVRDRLPEWAAARRAQGADITWDAYRVDGYPLEIRVTFGNVRISGTKPLPYEAVSPAVAAWAAPWDLRLWHFAAPSARVEALTASSGFDTGGIAGAVGVPSDAPGAVEIDMRGLTGHGNADGLSMDDLHLVFAPPDTTGGVQQTLLHLGFDAKGVAVRKPPPPFGGLIQEIAVTGDINGGMPAGGDLQQMLDAWRKTGGTVEITDSHFTWDKLDIRAKGTAALDDTLQPMAAMNATMRGQESIVDAAVMAGMMQPGAATIAKAVLGLVSQPDAAGQRQITLPITAQNHKLYVGPAAIATIPTIQWQ